MSPAAIMLAKLTTETAMFAPLFAIMMIGTNPLDRNGAASGDLKMNVRQTTTNPYAAFKRDIASRAEDCQRLDFSKLSPASKSVISAQLSGASFSICEPAWTTGSSISINISGIYRARSGLYYDDIGETIIEDGSIEFISSGDMQPFKIYLYEDQKGNLFGTAHPYYRGATNIVVFTHDISRMFDR